MIPMCQMSLLTSLKFPLYLIFTLYYTYFYIFSSSSYSPTQ
jgi:hypothetical protein